MNRSKKPAMLGGSALECGGRRQVLGVGSPDTLGEDLKYHYCERDPVSAWREGKVVGREISTETFGGIISAHSQSYSKPGGKAIP